MKRILFAIGRALGTAGRATVALIGLAGLTAALANYTMTQGTGLGNGVPVAPSSSIGDSVAGPNVAYSTIRAAMASIPNPTAALTAMLTNTPAGSSLNGTSSFYVPNAQCKTLGGIGGVSPTGIAIDGAIGIGTGWSSAKILGVFLHELTHAMGREAGSSPFNFCRFTAVGARTFSGSPVTSYFSLDNGTTKIADYDNTADGGDFLDNGVQDAGLGGFQDNFDNHQLTNPLQVLSTIDMQVMNAMGFQ